MNVRVKEATWRRIRQIQERHENAGEGPTSIAEIIEAALETYERAYAPIGESYLFDPYDDYEYTPGDEHTPEYQHGTFSNPAKLRAALLIDVWDRAAPEQKSAFFYTLRHSENRRLEHFAEWIMKSKMRCRNLDATDFWRSMRSRRRKPTRTHMFYSRSQIDPEAE